MLMTRVHPRRLAVVLAALAAAVAGILPIHVVAQTHAFAWKATKGQGTVYLVGSVHMLTNDFYPLPP